MRPCSRDDFQKWIRNVLCDPELAEDIGMINSNTFGEDPRKEIIDRAQNRLNQLNAVF